MWAFSFKGRVEIVDFALQLGEIPYYEMEKICYCIEYHEQYNWNGNNVDDINTLILFFLFR